MIIRRGKIMKKTVAAALLAVMASVIICGTVTAAEYKITWKNAFPASGNQNACDRTITGISIGTGASTVIKGRSKLSFNYDTKIVETITYSPMLGCSKIRLDIICGYKDEEGVTDFLTGADISPCRDSTATIQLDKLVVQ
jgi:hypothetical protein